MKKLYFLLVVLVCTYFTTKAQTPGLIHTIAGGGSATTEGIAATSFKFSTTAGIWTDGEGNIYISDESGGRIKKIDATTGSIYTVAGISMPGFSGDGGAATAAKIGSTRSIRVDGANNLYLGDYGNQRVRKVDAKTRVITTVAGGGSSVTEGVPATNAALGFLGIDVDLAGNIYTYGNSRIRKVDASTGLIKTIAGGGSSSADGIPATTASISQPRFILTDPTGNLYFLTSSGDKIRRVDAGTGIITTVAGGGTLTTDGVPATSFRFSDHHSFSIDPLGNLILMDRTYGLIRKVDKITGIMNIIYGGGTSKAEGVPATAADIRGTHWIHIDRAGNLYITNWTVRTARRINDYPFIGYGTTTVDSFSVSVNKLCNGPEMIVNAAYYSPSMYIKTDFGDGKTDSSSILPGYISGAYAIIKHSYNAAGSYTINQVLYRGTTAVDTFTTTYNYTFCRSLPVKIYFEDNGNCIKDMGETLMSLSSLAQVDSNGKPVDTISITSGFNYSAYCAPGSVYSFKLIKKPGDLITSCTSLSAVTDTVLSTVTSYPDKFIALSCPTSSSFDFGVNAVVPVTGVNDQWGNIYVDNTACLASGATVTLNFSPKWVFDVSSARPAAVTVTGTSATWNIAAVSADDPKPINLYYVMRPNPLTGMLKIRDTVRSSYVVTPIATDADTSNNRQDRVDTVRAGCDPNEIYVSPTGHILPCTQLQYTVVFENTGNDTAHNIYVMDTLSDNLDPKSLRIVMASHEMNLTMLKEGPYNIARFDFPKINLLDSSHHGECDGAVIYNINAKSGLADGTSIFNHAGIFFDVNDVVRTGTVENIIGIKPIDGAGSVCVGTTDTLTNATAGGVWKSSSTNATVAGGVVTGVSAGTATISYTVSNSCASQTKTKVVTIGSVAPLPITGPSNICIGVTAALTDASAGGVWSSGNTTVATISSMGVVSSVTVGTAVMSYTITNSCGTASAILPMTVSALPAVYTITGGGSMCVGDTGAHIGISGSDAGINYQLYNGFTMAGSPVSGTGTSMDMGLYTVAGVYTIKANNGTTTCSSDMTGSTLINVDPVVVPTVSLSSLTTLCAGTPAAFAAATVFGGTAPSYMWYINGVASTGVSVYTYPPVNGDVITVVMKSNAVCARPDTAVDTKTLVVNIPLNPVVSITKTPSGTIKKGEPATFAAMVTDGGTSPAYQWLKNGKLVPGATLATYTDSSLTDKDSVSCLVTSNDVCGTYTASGASIVEVKSLSIRTQNANSSFAVYPNPVNDILTINADKNAYTSYSITNSIGQVLLQQELTTAQTSVNVKALPAGLYYVTLKGDNGIAVQKFVKL